MKYVLRLLAVSTFVVKDTSQKPLVQEPNIDVVQGRNIEEFESELGVWAKSMKILRVAPHADTSLILETQDLEMKVLPMKVSVGGSQEDLSAEEIQELRAKLENIASLS